MMKLTTKYPDTKFYFLIGSDQLEVLHKWYNIDELAKICQLVVIKRPNYVLNEEKVKMCEVVTNSGAEFIKTSTGFSKAGATFEDGALTDKKEITKQDFVALGLLQRLNCCTR